MRKGPSLEDSTHKIFSKLADVEVLPAGAQAPNENWVSANEIYQDWADADLTVKLGQRPCSFDSDEDDLIARRHLAYAEISFEKDCKVNSFYAFNCASAPVMPLIIRVSLIVLLSSRDPPAIT